jgi:hypothetical protein
MAQHEPTIASILQQLAAHYHGVVAEREVFDRVLERRPSNAKDPYASIREKLRFGAPRVGWVRLGGGELIPLRVALQGLRFRVTPSDDEFAGDMIERDRLEPFVSRNEVNLRLEDATGRPLPARAATLPVGEGIFGPVSVPALSLGDWFQRVEFEPGDSVIVTIRQVEPLTLGLEREPATAFRAEDVARQERELVDELVQQVARGRNNMLFAEDSVLPIYARAQWRTGYPGRPWQQLVASDRRLRLVDRLYIADSNFRRPLDMLFGDEQQEQRWEELDQELLGEITRFQAELLASRREAAKRGLWNGIAPRASTGRVIFDMRAGTPQLIHPGIVDALQDYSADIEERAAHGGFDQDWNEDLALDDFDDLDADDLDLDDEELDSDDELFDLEDIADMQTFMEQNPALVESTKKLMASLTPEEIARLEEAENPDEVHQILIGRLNKMLFSDPALFVTLAPSPPINDSDGTGLEGDLVFDDDQDGEWDEDELLDDEEWDEDELDQDDFLGGDTSELQVLIERSNELMQRFYQYQTAQGKSETTAASRTGDLWIYADFLANYYGRTLETGDYATLDECLFFYYPRKVLNSSARAVREMCTSIKQFYAFLRAEGVMGDDAFAQAMWSRRDQAARAVELYGRIDGDSPHFERLFAHLFAPYTA